jgi:hypothetical protein
MVDKVSVDKGEVATGVVESFAIPGHRERLAGRASDDGVGVDERLFGPFRVFGHVPEVRDGRVAVGEDGAGERLDLREPYALPSEWRGSYGGGVDAGTEGDEFHII